jgi:carboxyl-terminal processing protease
MLSRTDRLGGLFRLGWAVQTHFVNFDLVPALDWEAAVTATIPAVEQAESVSDYYRALSRLVAQLQDGHTFVVEPEALRAERGHPAVELAWVESRPVVTWAAPPLQGVGVGPGTAIVAVDGRPAQELIEERRTDVSASTEHGLQALLCQQLLIGPRDKPADVRVDDGRGERVLSLDRDVSLAGSPAFMPAVESRRLDHGIGYIAINTFLPEDVVTAFDRALDAVLESRGLVLDLRRNTGGNGRYARDVAGRLTDRTLRFERARTRQTISSMAASGWPAMFLEMEPGVQLPRPRPFLGPVTVLIGPRTASAAEDFLVGLADTGRATLVGEPSAGSTGQPLRVDLPGGGWGSVCTRRCLYPAGREFVGRGIQPDIKVSPTIDGLHNGQDKVLETARAWLVSHLGIDE